MSDDEEWKDEENGEEEDDWGDEAADGEEGEWASAEFDDDGAGMMSDGVDGMGSGMDGECVDGSGMSRGLGLDVELANLYYEAEDERRDRPEKALDKFQQVVEMTHKAKLDGKKINEESKTNQFNAIVHIVCLLYQLHHAPNAPHPVSASSSIAGVSATPTSALSAPSLLPSLSSFLPAYSLLLDLIPQVTRNESSDAIDRVLSTIQHSSNYHTTTTTTPSMDHDLLMHVYELTDQRLAAMADTEKMRFNVRMKLARTYMDKKQFDKGQEVLRSLLASVEGGQSGSGSSSSSSSASSASDRGSDLLEIYAMQIKMSSQRGDAIEMKELYEKTKDLTAAVKDPRSQSVIRECWGLMFGSEGSWSRSYSEFYSAFSHYQEIGERTKAKQMLKYVVIANMLSGGEQNPFDAREAKVYQKEADIEAIGGLRNAYEKCDVDAFGKAMEEILKDGDQFIATHLDRMVRDFHRRALIHLLRSYRRVHLSFLAQRLRLSVEAVEPILVALIYDGEIGGRIDQVNQLLDLSSHHTLMTSKKYQAIQQFTQAIQHITQHQTIQQ